MMTYNKTASKNRTTYLEYAFVIILLVVSTMQAQKKAAAPEWSMKPNWGSNQEVKGSWVPLQLTNDKKMDYINIFTINVNSKVSSQVAFQAYISNGDGTYDKKNFWPTYQTQNVTPWFGDINGDGMDDVIYNLPASNHQFQIQCYFSQGDGTWKKTAIWNGTKLDFSDWYWYITDVNDDKKDDLVRLFDQGGKMHFGTFISNGDGTFQNEYVWNTNRSTSGEWLSMDINGDGKTDIANLWDYDSKEIFTMYFANGNGEYNTVPDFGTGRDDGGRWSPVDVNGDGKMDIVNFWSLSGNEVFTTYFSNGNGTFNISGNWDSHRNTSGSWITADVNGDGKTDILNLWELDDHEIFSTYLSNGDGNWNNITDYNTGKNPTGDWVPQDVNGDGKADIANIWNYNNDSQIFQIYLSEIK